MQSVTASNQRPARRFEVPLLVATVVVAALISFPSNFSPPFETGLDADWQAALHEIAARGLHFVSDVTFTFGPLGYLFLPRYHPETAGAVALTLMALGGLTGLALWRRFETIPSLVLRSLATLVLVAFVANATSSDTRLYFLCVLLLLEGFTAPRRPVLLALLGVAGGAILLAKASVAAAAVVVIAAVSLHDALTRRLPLTAGFAALSFLAGWKLSGQEFGLLPDFIRTMAASSSGYAAAMGHPHEVPLRSFTDPLIFLAASACLLALARRVAGSHRAALLHPLALSVFLFVIAKAAFVRHDLPHLFIAIEVLIVTAAAYAALAPRDRNGVALVAFAGGAALLWGMTTWRPYPTALTDPSRLVRLPRHSIAEGVRFVRDRSEFTDRYDRAASEYRERSPELAQVSGTFDSLSSGQSAVAAWGLAWSPRPAIQSYFAYTDDAMLANARHFRSNKAPEFLWLQFSTIDDRWPMQDDARALLEVLHRYEVHVEADDRALLRQAAYPRAYSVRPLTSRRASLGERVELPAGAIWLEADVRPSAWGRFAGTALRPSALVLRIKIEGEPAPQEARLVASIARNGFLVSPVVRTTDDAVRLLRGDVLPRAESIEILEPSGVGMWKKEIALTLSQVETVRP